MSRPEISVIIPYYNAVRHIERAARSLFGQSLGRRLETVWVDDGSTDGSAALLHSILSEEGADAPLYTTLTHDHNRGSAAARLTGLSAASGRYIIFCDADDYVDNDAYETMLHTACTTGADMVVCDYIVERGDSRVRHTGMRDSRSLTSDMLRGKVHVSLWNKLIARHLFDSIRDALDRGDRHVGGRVGNYPCGLPCAKDRLPATTAIPLRQQSAIIHKPF